MCKQDLIANSWGEYKERPMTQTNREWIIYRGDDLFNIMYCLFRCRSTIIVTGILSELVHLFYFNLYSVSLMSSLNDTDSLWIRYC